MTNWIVAAPKGGRCRAKRRWDEGHTVVPPEEQSEALWQSIKNDPVMHIAQRASDPEMADDIASFLPSDVLAGGTRVVRPADASAVEGPIDKTNAPRAVIADPPRATAPSIEAAIRTLRPSSFAEDGKPHVLAIEAAIVAAGGAEVSLSGAERDAVWSAMLNGGFTAPVSEANPIDTLIEQAVRAFGPDDFTTSGEPRMSALGDAVQKLAYPNGEETGVIVTSEDRDRVFKRMLTAEFKAPVADAAT